MGSFIYSLQVFSLQHDDYCSSRIREFYEIEKVGTRIEGLVILRKEYSVDPHTLKQKLDRRIPQLNARLNLIDDR